MNADILSTIERNRAAQIENAKQEKDWHQFIFAHERYDRLNALAEVMLIASVVSVDIWPLITSVWMDQESPDIATWTRIWSGGWRARHRAMTEAERAALKAMGSKITVYRGYNDPDREHGLSWTTDREQAIWFAQRFADVYGRKPILMEGNVKRKDVIAYLTGRSERELIIAPGNVNITSIGDAA